MSSPSILSALQKLRSLLTRAEKFKCLKIAGFALCVSILEVMTTSVIVIFAQILNQPEMGQKYLTKLGFTGKLSAGRIVFYIALLVGAMYLLKNMIAGLECFYQNFTIQKMSYHFKNTLLHRYAKVDYGFYLTRNSSLGMTVIGEVDQVFSTGMIPLAVILSEILVFLCLIGMIVYMNPSLALIIFALGAGLGFWITKGLLPKFYQWGLRLQEVALLSHQNLIQFFYAFKEIILLGKRETFINAYQYYSQKKSRICALQMATGAIPKLVIETLFIGIFVLAIGVLCFDHESPVQMIGILGGYLYVGFRLMPGLNRMINQLNLLKGAIPYIERVYDEYHMVAAKESYLDIHNFTYANVITLKDMSFRYLNTQKDALHHLSLEIKKGESIGIIGETGSGKSTLVDVILGLLKPYQGSVLVDNAFTVSSYQWHQKIGYVPQSIYLIDDTIEANIAFGEKEVDADRLQSVIDAAQLRNFIKQLPNKEKTVVGERGIRLSGGERQRIAIARALYYQPEVLIFDEATSALDNDTESNLMETIYKVSQNRTVIMIAHRLTTLKDCDRIVRMEKGQIKEITQYENIQKDKVHG